MQETDLVMQSPESKHHRTPTKTIFCYTATITFEAPNIWQDGKIKFEETLLPKLSADGGYAHLQQHAHQEFSGAFKAHGHCLHTESSRIVERIY